MKGLEQYLLEAVLLFTLVIHIFRSEQITNPLIIFFAAIPLFVFILFSVITIKSKLVKNVRLLVLILILVITNHSILFQKINERKNMKASVHDGVIMTEVSYKALISGRNPYSENLSETLEREKYTDVSLRPTIHYPYSPLMFLTNVPVFLITDNLFGVLDMRISLVILFFLTAYVGTLMVREKILFLIIFLSNPLFVPLLYYGANDIIILFLFFLLVYFLHIKRETWATIMLGLATGTKLLILPLAPLYFLYLFMSFKKGKTGSLIKQMVIFFLVNLVIHLPFLIWNSRDIANALLSPWIGMGEELYPIAGYFGIAQILTGLGLISKTSSFPFLIFVVPFEAIFLVISFKILKKYLNIQTFSIIFVFNLLLILAFSRIVQTYYLAFISQILLLSSFVGVKSRRFLLQKEP